MLSLVLDTADLTGGLAIARGEALIGSRTWIEGRRHSEFLWPSICELLQENRLSLSDLGVVIATHGPGRLTGVRLGLTIAKSLCMTLSLPLVLVSRFDQQARSLPVRPGSRLAVLLRTAHGQLGVQLYDSQSDVWVALSPPQPLPPEEPLIRLRGLLPGPHPILAGSAAPLLEVDLEGVWPEVTLDPTPPSLGALLLEGLHRLRTGKEAPPAEARPFDLDAASGLLAPG